MRPVSAGRLAARATKLAHSNAIIAKARRALPLARGEEERPAVISTPSACGGASELYLRRLLRIFVRSKFCHRFIGAEDSHGPQQARKGLELGIVGPHGFDVVAPCYCDAVLGALKLRLERKEVLIRFEVGVVLTDSEQTTE